MNAVELQSIAQTDDRRIMC